MAIRNVPAVVDLSVLEHEVLSLWQETGAFSKLRELRLGSPKWHFLDGPITANNPMGVHHAWGRTYKDVWQRFKAMQGHELRWQNGFDCQGLWVEVNVEKELGLKTKRDIEAIGIGEFIVKCKQRVLTYAAELTRQSQRLGMWMDWDDPGKFLMLRDALALAPEQSLTLEGSRGPVAGTPEVLIGQLGSAELGGSFFTFSDENNYMIWQFLKRCWENGWLYRGTDVMPWCTRCGTGISQHEIATDGYDEITHQSVFVSYPLVDRPNTHLLVWTTTPWTLPANVVAAVNPAATYAEVKQGDRSYIVARSCVERVMVGDYEIRSQVMGKELVGLRYSGLFDDLPIVAKMGIPDAHRVLAWNEVSDEEGTGVVHISPGSGAEDFTLGKAHNTPILAPLTEDGNYIEGFGWLSGQSVHEVRQDLFEYLKSRGALYRTEPITHRYPVCWRCREELVFRLVDEWYISMGARFEKPRSALSDAEKKSSLRYQIMDVADPIRWVPSFGAAREQDWLQNMDDWMISKKRYWGLALPIWVCSECDSFDVIGSKEELAQRAISGWDEFSGHSPHRPFIDHITIECSRCRHHMTRVPDVGNPWLDAGIVAYSTLQYGTDSEYFDRWFPADFITESFPGQFRNWFYAVLAMSAVLENATPYKSVLGYALLVGEDGRPMHKSWGNAISFDEGVERIGADVMRWMFCAHPPERNMPFGYHAAEQVRRGPFNTLWNVYSFFTTYAHLEDWTPTGAVRSASPIDRWIEARLAQTIDAVTLQLDEFSGVRATDALAAFIEDLSNWYVRRSRRRFWQSEDREDQERALSTLHYVLISLAKLLAPIMPFVSESIYQNLVVSVDSHAPRSVHHCDWPSADKVDEALLSSMSTIRLLASLGHSARHEAKVKVRQPLAEAIVVGCPRESVSGLESLLMDELNVKNIRFDDSLSSYVDRWIDLDYSHWGPRLKGRLSEVRDGLRTATDGQSVEALSQGREFVLTLEDGTDITLTPGNAKVVTLAKDGFVLSSSESGATVILDTRVSQELEREGLAREVVRRVQVLRKDLDLRVDQRIAVVWSGGNVLGEAIREHSELIMTETLAEGLEEGDPRATAQLHASDLIDGHEFVVGISARTD